MSTRAFDRDIEMFMHIFALVEVLSSKQERRKRHSFPMFIKGCPIYYEPYGKDTFCYYDKLQSNCSR